MRLRPSAALVLAGLLSSTPALAQTMPPNRAEPGRGPANAAGTDPSANRARVTSGLEATQPSAAEQRSARALAGAIFAKPAAARRAADNAAPEPPPAWAAAQLHDQGTDQPQVTPGGRGVKITQPF